MYSVGVVSLGCSKNRVDTELMLGILRKAGYRITADELTYSLHPIIRFEMEKDWFDG